MARYLPHWHLPDWFRPQHWRGGRNADQGAEPEELTRVSLGSLLGLRARSRHFLLDPRRPAAAAQPVGYRSAARGRGLDFDEYREYQPGESVRHIDWRVTARTGRPHSRLYREERERAVYVVVDYRPGMFFASRGRFKSVLAAQAAALLAWAAAECGDRIGGLVFTGQGLHLHEPRARRHGVLPLLQSLVAQQASFTATSPVSRLAADTAESVTLADALLRLDRLVRPGSMVLLLSDFAGLNGEAEARLARLARRCDVLGGLLYDPLEQALPEAGQYWIASLPGTGADSELARLDVNDPAVSAAHAARFRRHHDRVVRAFTGLRLHLLRLATHHNPDESLRRLFRAHAALRWRG